MANESLYVVDLKQSYANEPIHNLFTYERNVVNTALELWAAFVSDVLPAINAIQVPAITNVSLKVYSMGNLGDFWEDAITGTGTSSLSAMLPIHDALNFTLKPASRAVRPGSKRFAGVPVEATTNGVVTSSGYITLVNALVTALGDAIEVEVDEFFTPVIVKRVKYNPDPAKPLHFAYRYPLPTDPEATFAHLGAVLWTRQVSHQDSRGNGK